MKQYPKIRPLIYLLTLALLVFFSRCGKTEKAKPNPDVTDDEKLGKIVRVKAPSISGVEPIEASTDIAINTDVKVTFSKAISPASVTTNTIDIQCSGSIQVSTDNFNTCIAMKEKPTLSGQTVSVTPKTALTNGTTYKIKVTTEVKDLQGTPLERIFITESGFTTQVIKLTWHFIDDQESTGLNNNNNLDATNPQVIVHQSKLYVAWQEDNKIRVAVTASSENPSWSLVEGNGKIGLNQNPENVAANPSITVFSEKLFLVWSESNGSHSQIRVAVYNDDDISPAWRFIDKSESQGINKNPEANALTPFISSNPSSLYVTWVENNPTQVRIAKLGSDLNNPIWTMVDGDKELGINANGQQNATRPSFIASADHLYLGWSEGTTTKKIRVNQLTPSDEGPWTFIDNNSGINQGEYGGYAPRFVFHAEKIIATWSEAFQIRCASFDTKTSKWAFTDGNQLFGLNKNRRDDASDPFPLIFQDQLYMTWSEGSPSQIRVVRFDLQDGSSGWRFIDQNEAGGLNKDPTQKAETPVMVFWKDKLVVVWAENNGSAKQIRVVSQLE